MIRLRLLAVFGLLLAFGYGLVLAAPSTNFVNAASANNSPIPVGLTTPVVILYGRPRCKWRMNWPEAADLWCAPILPSGDWNSPNSAPAFVPAASTGYRFQSGGNPWVSGGSIEDDPSIGWSCVGSAAATVSTFEAQHCTGKALGQP